MKPYTYRRKKGSWLLRKWEILFEGSPALNVINVSEEFLSSTVKALNTAFELGQYDERAKVINLAE